MSNNSLQQAHMALTQGIPAASQPSQAKSIQEHKKAAQQFEALMLQMMIQSMRQASYKDEEDSNALDTFRGMYDQHLAESMAQQGGLGLASMLMGEMGKFRSELQAEPNALNTQTAVDEVMPPLVPNLSAKVQKAVRAYQEFQPESSLPVANMSSVKKSAATSPVLGRETPLLSSMPSLSQQKFIDALSPHAEQAAAKIGIAPELVVAHAALESGWGKRSIKHADGRESYNLFGIKASAQWQGKVVDVMTTEYIQGVAQKKVEKFRAYDSYSHAFDDYARLLTTNPRYQQALNQGGNGSEFAKALQKGGYATDPQYAQKLASVVQKVDSF